LGLLLGWTGPAQHSRFGTETVRGVEARDKAAGTAPWHEGTLLAVGVNLAWACFLGWTGPAQQHSPFGTETVRRSGSQDKAAGSARGMRVRCLLWVNLAGLAFGVDGAGVCCGGRVRRPAGQQRVGVRLIGSTGHCVCWRDRCTFAAHHSRRSISAQKPGPWRRGCCGFRGRAAVLHDFVEDNEDGRGREIAYAAQGFPGDLEIFAGEAQGFGGSFENFGAAGMHDPGADVAAGHAVGGRGRRRHLGAEVFDDDFWGHRGTRTMLKPFSEMLQPMTSSVLG